MSVRPLMIAALMCSTVPAMSAPPQRNAELQALDDALPGQLINDPSNLDWPVYGSGVSHKPVKSTDAPGGGAIQINVPRKGANLFDAGINAPITGAIFAGQRITVAFYARRVKADTPDGNGILGVRIQQNIAPYAGFSDRQLSIGPEWRLYEVTGLAERDIPAGQAVVGFQLGGARQTIEIGQTIVVEGVDSIIPRTQAAQIPEQLSGKGRPINNIGSTDGWAFYGQGLGRKAVPARGTPGRTALQFTVPEKGTNAYDYGLSVPIEETLEEGDILNVAVLARTVSTTAPDGLGKITLRVQKNVTGYPAFGENTLSLGPSWKLIQLRTQARFDIPRDEGVIAIHLGASKQIVEIENVFVLKEESE